jgi:hypothetical protein
MRKPMRNPGFTRVDLALDGSSAGARRRAGQLLDKAESLAAQSPEPAQDAYARMLRARWMAAEGRHREAVQLASDALKGLVVAGHRGLCLMIRGTSLAALGRGSEATADLQQALGHLTAGGRDHSAALAALTSLAVLTPPSAV